MKTTIVAAVAAILLATPATAQAQAVEDYHAELKEWVYGPCMEVGAALAVGTLDQESRELGIKRRDIALLMLSSRDQAILDFAKTLASGKKRPSWEMRRDFYPPLLRLCIEQQQKDAE